MKKSLLFLLITSVLLVGLKFQKRPMEEMSLEKKQDLVQYLRSHWQTPEDYIVSKFQNHDIVFIGEAHHIKHDVELVHNLIPRLYKIGVNNLGMEFGCYEYQKKVDSLITAETYDENLARWLLFKWQSYWCFKEYMDIYRKAWELNKSLPPGAPKFRIVNLDYRARWDFVKGSITPVLFKKVFYKGDRDEHMASIILKEFVRKEKKALIYSGSHHAFTQYREQNYDFESKKIMGSMVRMGNKIYKKIPNKVFNISLHYPWPTRRSLKEFSYPVGRAIDRIMREFEDKKVGFDVRESPFGDLRDDSSFYSLGYEDFTLSEFCDGYIYQRHISDYQGCTVDPLFITKENFEEAIDYLPNPRLKKILKTPLHIRSYMEDEANMKKKFHGLE